MMHRVRTVAALAALLCGLLPLVAQAQGDYPSRPVRVLVGFGPGSSADLSARILAQRLSQTLGQQFVVENRAGAGSNIATEAVARAAKDGYTLFVGTVANTINVSLAPNTSFDFQKDLAPIALVSTLPNVLVVHPSTGARTVPELVALAKAKPGELSFASSGVGTSPHLSGELFNVMAGVKLVHVPYQGSAQAVTDLLAGRTAAMFSPASTVLQHVKEGKLTALASTQLKRAGSAPELPTMDEAGLKGFDTGVWFGLMAPAGTPKEIVDKLAQAVNEALKNDEVLARLHQQGIDPLGGTPEEFTRYLGSEVKKWADVASAAGLKK
jgi:tripartite-type tricarboxylate transporter receptor subunit TctC